MPKSKVRKNRKKKLVIHSFDDKGEMKIERVTQVPGSDRHGVPLTKNDHEVKMSVYNEQFDIYTEKPLYELEQLVTTLSGAYKLACQDAINEMTRELEEIKSKNDEKEEVSNDSEES